MEKNYLVIYTLSNLQASTPGYGKCWCPSQDILWEGLMEKQFPNWNLLQNQQPAKENIMRHTLPLYAHEAQISVTCDLKLGVSKKIRWVLLFPTHTATTEITEKEPWT